MKILSSKLFESRIQSYNTTAKEKFLGYLIAYLKTAVTMSGQAAEVIALQGNRQGGLKSAQAKYITNAAKKRRMKAEAKKAIKDT